MSLCVAFCPYIASGTEIIPLRKCPGPLPPLCICFSVSVNVPVVNCEGNFSYGNCSVTCGSGVKMGTFVVTRPASGGGSPCTNLPGDTATATCTLQPCGSCVCLLSLIFCPCRCGCAEAGHVSSPLKVPAVCVYSPRRPAHSRKVRSCTKCKNKRHQKAKHTLRWGRGQTSS